MNTLQQIYTTTIPQALDRVALHVRNIVSKVPGMNSSGTGTAATGAGGGAGLSDFQRQKLTHLFKTFYDTNNDGKITRADFTKMLKDLQQFRGWSQIDPDYAHAQEAITKVFVELRRVADDNKDAIITLPEWLDYWARFADEARQAGAASGAVVAWPADGTWQREYACFLFEFYDTSGDGSIDEDEYVRSLTLYGISETDCRHAFQRLTANLPPGRKTIDKQKYLDYYLEYLTSDNPAVSGNYLAGKINF